MVDFGKSDKMIKISRKVNKSNTYNGFKSNTSFFIQGRTSSDENISYIYKHTHTHTHIYIYIYVTSDNIFENEVDVVIITCSYMYVYWTLA